MGGRGSGGDSVFRILAGPQLLVPRPRGHSLSRRRTPSQRKSGLSWFLSPAWVLDWAPVAPLSREFPEPLFSRGVFGKAPRLRYLRLQGRSLLGGDTMIFGFLLKKKK